MHVNTEAHIHTLVSRKKAVFFSLSIVVASTVLVLCGGVIGKVVFASAHHVEVGPAGREQEALRQQHVHAIQRPNLPAACTGELRRGLPLTTTTLLYRGRGC